MIKLIKDGQVITDSQFLELHANISFPTQIPFEDYGYSVVFPKPKPTFDKYTQKVIPGIPILNTLNKYEEMWEIIDLTPEELIQQLNLARSQKIESLKAKYNIVYFEPIIHAGITWSTDQDSQNLLSQILSVGSVPTNMVWIDYIGIQHPMTYLDLQNLALAILERGVNAYQNMSSKITLVNNATTIADINAINW